MIRIALPLLLLIPLWQAPHVGIVFALGYTLALVLPPRYPRATDVRRFLSAPLRWLRQRGDMLWLLLVVAGFGVLAYGYRLHQPVWGRTPDAQAISYWCVAAWLWLLLAWGGGVYPPSEKGEARRLGAQLGRSPFVGALLTLTTVVLLLVGVESWMRIALIQSDAFSLTAMHYWWHTLYWRPINALGFRDNEPNGDPNRTQILVIGDSFASGHGVNSIEDSFPHQLQRGLGEGYAVNIAAQPGWESDAALAALNNYPIKPKIVVLSYFLNDINYLLPSDQAAINEVRFPEPPWSDFIRDYFVLNYLYWHVFQRPPDRGHFDTMLAAYQDPSLWPQHAATLTAFVDATRANDQQLVVVVWGALNAMPQSEPAVSKVAQLFRNQGVVVLDMTQVLAGENVRGIVANAFDAHPNAYAHQRAADALLAVLQNTP
jgi:hypothetical protein